MSLLAHPVRSACKESADVRSLPRSNPPEPLWDVHLECTTRQRLHHAINEVALFMEGRSDVLVRELHERMEGAADKLDFENAARYRDQLQSIEKIADRQKVLTHSRDDHDLIAYARRGGEVYVEIAYVRNGKMVGHDGHPLDGAGEATEAELLRGFVLQYYASATHVPRTLILPGALDEMELMTGWLGQRRGGPVTRAPRHRHRL